MTTHKLSRALGLGSLRTVERLLVFVGPNMFVEGSEAAARKQYLQYR